MIEMHHEILRQILEIRGITGDEEIQEFLSDSPQKTYDPFLLLNMRAGVDLILDRIRENCSICIYGDYDCDGVTSVSVLLQILGELSNQITYYIPSRFDEGYGLNKEAIRKIQETGAGLIITVDCGSVSVEEVELAKELGMDILITDHHTMGDRVPDCLVINPKQTDCPYPFKDLSGCGIAFKMAQAIQQQAGLPKSSLTGVLDLVAIGTVGDIVPLIDENRTLVKYGLKALRSTKRPGLRLLADKISLKLGTIHSESVAYVIVPHINAAGRIGSPHWAVQLLTTKNSEQQEQMAAELVRANRQRKDLQEKAFQRCLAVIQEEHQQDLFVILQAEGVHEGIAGIVAGKIKDRLNRPVVLVTDSGEHKEYLKGTGRSIGSVNIHQLLKGGEQLFEKFGGHSGACGFLMRREGLAELRNFAEEEMKRLQSENPNLFQIHQTIDYTFEGSEISIELIRTLETLGPFGFGNEKPCFLISDIRPDRISRMGGAGEHLRFEAICRDGTRIPCVLFGEANRFEEKLNQGNPIGLIGSLGLNEWNNRLKIQFVVQDITW